jgi:hypothetical protein
MQMFQRILGVFKLDVNTFEEIEHDQSATSQAALVVILIGIISGIGSGIFAGTRQGSFFGSFIGTLVSMLVGWVIWSVVSWFVGTRFFNGQADVSEMLRVIGFAYSPQILGIIPCIGGIVGAIWSLIAGFIAVRQGLDLDNTKTFFTVLIGFILYVIVYAILGLFMGGATALLGG